MNARKNLFFVLPLFLLCSLHAELPIPNETADGSEDEHLFYGIWKQTLNNQTSSPTPINRRPTENLNADHTAQKAQQSKAIEDVSNAITQAQKKLALAATKEQTERKYRKIDGAIAAAFCVGSYLTRDNPLIETLSLAVGFFYLCNIAKRSYLSIPESIAQKNAQETEIQSLQVTLEKLTSVNAAS